MSTPLFYFSSSSSSSDAIQMMPNEKNIPMGTSTLPSVSESFHEKSQNAVSSLPSVVRLSGGYCAAPFDCAKILKPHVAALYDSCCDVDIAFKIDFPSWGPILDRRASSGSCFLDFSSFETWLLFGPIGPTDATGGKFKFFKFSFFSSLFSIEFASMFSYPLNFALSRHIKPAPISCQFLMRSRLKLGRSELLGATTFMTPCSDLPVLCVAAFAMIPSIRLLETMSKRR